MKTLAVGVTALGLAVAVAIGNVAAQTKTVTVSKPGVVETVYVVNHATHYISDREIKADIPAWELAANRDFAPIWHTPQVRIVFKGREKPPAGAIVAVFKSNGPIQGALAFHEVVRGNPAIVVYAGTGRYYGFDNSVSFTHELFEMLDDHPAGTIANQGWPYPYMYVGEQQIRMTKGTVWSQEVSDAVEAYDYKLNGVRISDFVTPNWYNDHVAITRGGFYDFLGVVQQPFSVVRGGYACFWTTTWTCVQDFRHAGPDAAGFYKGERDVRRRYR